MYSIGDVCEQVSQGVVHFHTHCGSGRNPEPSLLLQSPHRSLRESHVMEKHSPHLNLMVCAFPLTWSHCHSSSPLLCDVLMHSLVCIFYHTELTFSWNFLIAINCRRPLSLLQTLKKARRNKTKQEKQLAPILNGFQQVSSGNDAGIDIGKPRLINREMDTVERAQQQQKVLRILD